MMRCPFWCACAVAAILGMYTGLAPAQTPGQPEKPVKIVISGRPPLLLRAAAAEVPVPNPAAGTNSLSEVPAFDWSFGCSATSGAMMAGYYDRHGYANVYTGTANGGLCPLVNDCNPIGCSGHCSLSATENGLDGRSTRGHVNDYWIGYGNCNSDPYITNGWTQHASGDCVGDFMGTNQSAFGNCDGATTFWFYTNGARLYDYDPGSGNRDGCHGLRLFFQSRGYTVTTNFSQYIKGKGSDPNLGFTFADYQAEIDAGCPVLIQVDNHTMLGFGYNTTGSVIYLHDTWDYGDHEMTWGGSYQGLNQYAVTVVRLQCSTPASPTGVTAGDGTYCDKVHVAWNVVANAAGYKVYRSTSNVQCPEPPLAANVVTTSYDDATASPGVTYYYSVKAIGACGDSGCSGTDSGYRAGAPSSVTGVSASDGTFADRVRVTWASVPGATYYKLYRSTTDVSCPEPPFASNVVATTFDDMACGGTYYYSVKACNGCGCSDGSGTDPGFCMPCTPAELIVDNGGTGFSTAGSGWACGSYPGQCQYGAGFCWHGKSTASDYARWTAPNPCAGTSTQVEVFAWWSQNSPTNRATDAPYEIWDGAVRLAEMRMNQQLPACTSGDRWQSLGTYTISGPTFEVRLRSDIADPTKYVIADAIKWTYCCGTAPPGVNSFAINNGDAVTTTATVVLNNTCSNAPTEYMASEDPGFVGAGWLAYSTAPSFTLSAGDGVKTVYFKVRNTAGESAPVNDTITLSPGPCTPTEAIVDNGDAGFSTVGSGWTCASYPGQCEYGTGICWHGKTTAADYARWTAPNPAPGSAFRIYAWWSQSSPSNRAIDAPYEIFYDGGSTVVRMNQQQPSCVAGADRWVELVAAPGTTYTISGATLEVRLRSDIGSSSQYVIADAVKWTYCGGAQLPTVSGRVTDSTTGAGVSGVTMSGLPGDPTTGTDGGYSVAVTSGWSGTVTPTKGTCTFSPPSLTYVNVTTDQAGQDYVGSCPVGCTPATIIVDNVCGTSASFFQTAGAGWTCYNSGTAECQNGSDFVYHGKGTADQYAEWTAPNPSPGAQVRVYGWWPYNRNRATDAPFEVYCDGGPIEVRANQQLPPCPQADRWVELKDQPDRTYTFGSTLKVRLRCDIGDATKYVIADAIKFEVCPSAAPPCSTVDNTDPGYSETGTGWLGWASTGQCGYGSNFRYHARCPDRSAYAKWLVPNPCAGQPVDVFAWWSQSSPSNRATDAPYEVICDGVPTAVVQDQSVPVCTPDVSRWQSLGRFTCNGPTIEVRLYCNISDATRYVIADAVAACCAGGTPQAAEEAGLAQTAASGEPLVLADRSGETVPDTGPMIVPADFDADGDVDLVDFQHLRACFGASGENLPGIPCDDADINKDGVVDMSDFLIFQGCYNGPNRPPSCR